MIENSLDVQDYLDATSDASKRTRTVTIILVVASIVVWVGLLNSLQGHWMLRRMVNLADIHGEYTESKLGAYPDSTKFGNLATYRRAVELYEERYRDLCAAISRAYVENSLIIRVPFLGISVDVNDLGLLGGTSLLIILGCFRFCLSREIDNLKLSFEEAERLDKLSEFYHLLAMRQVFTIPTTRHIKRTNFLLVTPKLICWLPLGVHLLVVANDVWKTAWIGDTLNHLRFKILMGIEIILTFLLLLATLMVIRRLKRLDAVWNVWWHKVQLAPANGFTSADPLLRARDDIVRG